MNRTSNDRAAIRLSLAVSITLSVLLAGLFALTAKSGPQVMGGAMLTASQPVAHSAQPLAPGVGAIVISQVYGGGGNSGAPLKNDFIELFNRGSAPVDITGWSVQYASATGTTYQVTALT